MRFETLKRVQDALACIRAGELDHLDCGRHELFDGVYVTVSSYETRKDGVYEAHRKYIDIQYLLEGAERIDIADLAQLRITQDYAEETDCLLGLADGKPYLLQAGQFLLLFPEEVHRPGMEAGAACTVKKAVIKVPV